MVVVLTLLEKFCMSKGVHLKHYMVRLAELAGTIKTRRWLSGGSRIKPEDHYRTKERSILALDCKAVMCHFCKKW